jgi:hypothetical protein
MSQPTDVDAVRQTLTADLPPLDPAVRAAAWQTLRMASLAPAPVRARRPAPLRSWRTAIRVAVPAVAIAVALTIIVAIDGRNGAAPFPAPLGVPTAEAAAILRQAAQHLAQGSPLTGSQARVIREDWLQLVVGRGRHGHTYRYVLPRTTEEGYDALGNAFYEELPDGTPRFADPAARAAYVRRFGRYVPIAPKPRMEQHYGADTPDSNFLNLSAHDVVTLPTDPGALRARLLRLRPGLAAQSEFWSPVELISRLLTFGPTPPAVRSALARVLATLPGVRRAGTPTIGGRPADVLAFPAPRGVGIAERLAFDRRTGDLLEEIDVLTARSRGLPGVAPGEIVNAIAYSPAVAATIDTVVHPRAITPADGPRP